MKLLILDNYDSFTYNIVHSVREMGIIPDVIRNDKISLDDIDRYDKIIISRDRHTVGSRCAATYAQALLTVKPILGICLGEQAIGECFGARLKNLSTVYHGIQSTIDITASDYLFEGASR